MKEIDVDNWMRKEHFNFFKNVAYPVYNICFDVDVTRLREYAKDKNLPFNLALVYLSTNAVCSVENLRYRLRGETVVLHDSLTPSFTDMKKDSDLFKMVTVEMEENLESFAIKAKEKSITQKKYFIAEDFAGRDDFIFYSIIPWISFTSIDHTINMKQGDAIPRVSWGKYYQRENRLFMPYNIQVNHMFVDGIHLGMFKDELDNKIQSIK
jgi:chloramphenicol O-acetyltransferase type A